jgi:hypothetical protein
MEAQKLLAAAPYGHETLKVLKQALDEACPLEAIHKHQPQRFALVAPRRRERWLRLFEQNFRVVKWAPAGVRRSAGQLKLTRAARVYTATQRGSEA